MEQVALVVAVLQVLRKQGVKAAGSVQVDDGHRPDVAGLLHALHVAGEPFVAFVLIAFVGLDVLLVAVEEGAVDGREQHNLLRGERAFQVFQCAVDASAIGAAVHRRPAVAAQGHGLVAVDGGQHRVFRFHEPLADGHRRVVVVGANEHQDGVEVLPVLGEQLVGLPGNVVPLPAAHGIDVGFYAQPVVQELPPFCLRSAIAWVGNRVAEIGHAPPLPGMLEEHRRGCILHFLLRKGRKGQRQAQGQRKKLFTHVSMGFRCMKYIVDGAKIRIIFRNDRLHHVFSRISWAFVCSYGGKSVLLQATIFI